MDSHIPSTCGALVGFVQALLFRVSKRMVVAAAIVLRSTARSHGVVQRACIRIGVAGLIIHDDWMIPVGGWGRMDFRYYGMCPVRVHVWEIQTRIQDFIYE